MPGRKKRLPIENPYKILVVDDESGPRDLLESALLEKGFQVKTAKSGDQACQFIDEEPFDLVLTDLKMPGLSGNELLKRIRQLSPETLIILITGYASLQSAIEAIRGGAYDYLTKPFQVDELYVVVNNAVERIKLIRENNKLLNQLRKSYKKMEAHLSPDALEADDPSRNLEFLQALQKRLLKVYTRTGSSGPP
ncbi:MAG: sigma-54-dependent transcriptional regulator [Nitrospiria bacterium]